LGKKRETPEADQAILDRFLVDNPELEDLSARLAQFNIFRALGIEHHEIRHSNVLAWLMDPAESHGLGEVPLRRLLASLLFGQDVSRLGLSAAEAKLMDFADVEVRREWKHIDIFFVSRANRLGVLIENKVWSGESRGQLGRGREAAEREFPGFTIIPVFLTLEGDEIRDEKEAQEYVLWSYVSILETLESLLAQRRSQMPTDVAAFLDHYMDVLRRLTMKDEKFAELCKTIYRKHRAAVEAVMKYGKVSVLNSVAEEAIKKKGGLKIISSSGGFVPRTG